MLQTGHRYDCVCMFGLILSLGYTTNGLNKCPAHLLPRKPSCHYGTLPGRWLKGTSGEIWTEWNLYRPGCQLQNLLGAASPPELDLSLLRDEVGILLLGDSVDRFVASDICAGQPYLHKEWSQDLDTYAVCR